MTPPDALRAPPRIRRRLAALAAAPLNFDRDALRDAPGTGWRVDDIRHPLPREEPGAPAASGSFAIAARLIRGYEFADPSIVRAYYDPAQPLEGRTMLLRLRALGLVSVSVGVRILDVIDEACERDGRPLQVWGWRYGTLAGHVEQGEMSWEVWKWLDTGEVDFRVHAISRRAHISNPIIALGFRLVGSRERTVFLRSTGERMRSFTELALQGGGARGVRDAAAELTARPFRDSDRAHDQLAANLADPLDH
jgi:uncharacterized protein (UPF0548 family)